MCGMSRPSRRRGNKSCPYEVVTQEGNVVPHKRRKPPVVAQGPWQEVNRVKHSNCSTEKPDEQAIAVARYQHWADLAATAAKLLEPPVDHS